MKVALISSFPTFPTNEGARARILNFARSIRLIGHELIFIYLPTWRIGEVDIKAHYAEFGSDRFIQLKGSPAPGNAPLYFRLKRKLLKLFSDDRGYYNYLDEFYLDSWTTQLRELHKSIGFDGVIVEYALHSKAFSAFGEGILKILDTHDSFADRHKAYANTNNKDGFWFSLPPEIECDAFRRADAILAIQENEEAGFRDRLGGAGPKVVTVSHILELGERVEDYGSPNALFVGSANDANYLSMNAFCENIFPLIHKELPDFRLHVAGNICGRLPDLPAIVKLGRVDKLIDAFRDAPLSLNPMLVGTGINIKLLDAMAVGVGTISTECGARGLYNEYRNSISIVADDNPIAFANEVIRFSKSDGLRQELGNKALAAAKLWNKAQIENLEQVLNRDNTPTF